MNRKQKVKIDKNTTFDNKNNTAISSITFAKLIQFLSDLNKHFFFFVQLKPYKMNDGAHCFPKECEKKTSQTNKIELPFQ